MKKKSSQSPRSSIYLTAVLQGSRELGSQTVCLDLKSICWCTIYRSLNSLTPAIPDLLSWEMKRIKGSHKLRETIYLQVISLGHKNAGVTVTTHHVAVLHFPFTLYCKQAATSLFKGNFSPGPTLSSFTSRDAFLMW